MLWKTILSDLTIFNMTVDCLIRILVGEGSSDSGGLEIPIKQCGDALTSRLPTIYLDNRHISLVPSACPLPINLECKSLSLN